MSDTLSTTELLRVLDKAWKHGEPSSVFAQAYVQIVRCIVEHKKKKAD